MITPDGTRLLLGIVERARRVRATPKAIRETRTVRIEDAEYEIVWDGHRDGPTLLAYCDDDPREDHSRWCHLTPLHTGRMHHEHGEDD